MVFFREKKKIIFRNSKQLMKTPRIELYLKLRKQSKSTSFENNHIALTTYINVDAENIYKLPEIWKCKQTSKVRIKGVGGGRDMLLFNY